MNILHIINALPQIGGAERLVLDMAQAQKSWNMRVLTWVNADISLCDELTAGDIEVLALRPVTIAKIRKAKHWISEADIIHVHLYPSLYLGALLPGKKMYTEHNTWNRRRKYRLARIVERQIYRRYTNVVAISDAVRDSLKGWLTASTVPITVIQNGVSLHRFANKHRKISKQNEKITIGMAGSFTKQKYQEILVKILPELPDSVHLLFAGDGPCQENIEELVKRLKLTERVVFLGNVRDISSYYKNIDIYVQSSHWEGFGLTVIEAMASGLPSLASDVPGLADIVGNKDMLFDNNDTDRLISIIKLLIASPSLYCEWSMYSLKRAKLFSSEKMVQAYTELYKKIHFV